MVVASWQVYCRRDWCTSQNKRHHKEASSCESIEARHLNTSAIKLKLGHKGVFQKNNDRKHTFKVEKKCLKDNKIKVFQWPWNQYNRNICGQKEKSMFEQESQQS